MNRACLLKARKIPTWPHEMNISLHLINLHQILASPILAGNNWTKSCCNIQISSWKSVLLIEKLSLHCMRFTSILKTSFTSGFWKTSKFASFLAPSWFSSLYDIVFFFQVFLPEILSARFWCLLLIEIHICSVCCCGSFFIFGIFDSILWMKKRLKF